MISDFFQNLYHLWIEAAPWLLFGLVIAGLLDALLPQSLLSRWLGKPGFGSILKASLLGTPLPLCSCSVVPAALTIHRGGASRGATVSFLIATPENGADSIALSWPLLGPFLTVVRPLAAILSAIFAGLLAGWGEKREQVRESTTNGDPTPPSEPEDAAPGSSCCDASCGKDTTSGQQSKLARGFHFAFIKLLDDVLFWLLFGVLVAAVLETVFPVGGLGEYGRGPFAMLLALVIGIPMYVCATASTPIAAAMLVVGVSPGTVLVFLLAGPATNLGTLAIVRRELGKRAFRGYLLGILGCSFVMGLLTDWIAALLSIDVASQVGEGSHASLPFWVAQPATWLLTLWILWLIARKLLKKPAIPQPASS
ncbi:MAG TPA: permease [Planctomycetes bacterium]|nr:permease [Planctomycetota bacterium]